MSDTAVYLYAVGDTSLAESAERTVMTGVDGTPIRTIVTGQLAAVVSSVDRERFSEESLRRALEDLHWLEEVARIHHRIVDRLARAKPLAPVRLATIYLGDDNVRALLTDKAADFAEVLSRIRGRTEWGVKAFAVQPPQPPEPAVGHGARPGTAYLMHRRAQRDQAALGHQQAMDAAEEVHREVSRLSVASRRYPPQDPRLSGQRDEMVLNAAYLVPGPAAAALRRLVEEWNTPGLRLELTGPWAAYSFATLDER